MKVDLKGLDEERFFELCFGWYSVHSSTLVNEYDTVLINYIHEILKLNFLDGSIVFIKGDKEYTCTIRVFYDSGIEFSFDYGHGMYYGDISNPGLQFDGYCWFPVGNENLEFRV